MPRISTYHFPGEPSISIWEKCRDRLRNARKEGLILHCSGRFDSLYGFQWERFEVSGNPDGQQSAEFHSP